VLKRYQVLLPDWLEDYIKFLVEKYGLSFSEVIRVKICLSVLSAVANLYPEIKLGITLNEITEMEKNNVQDTIKKDEMHRLLSKIYFETRKAAEHRLAKERKQKK
jgi:ABC-type polysaccharide transport system permease subunit